MSTQPRPYTPSTVWPSFTFTYQQQRKVLYELLRYDEIPI